MKLVETYRTSDNSIPIAIWTDEYRFIYDPYINIFLIKKNTLPKKDWIVMNEYIRINKYETTTKIL